MLKASWGRAIARSCMLPLTIEMSSGVHVVIHEADLVDYPRMFLAKPRREGRTLHAVR